MCLYLSASQWLDSVYGYMTALSLLVIGVVLFGLGIVGSR